MMNENVARDAAPNTAPIATSANAPGDRCAPGNTWLVAIANSPPMAALHMNVGASNPPDVPDPSDNTSAANFANITISRIFHASCPLRMAPMVSYPTPNTRGTKYPMIPSPSAPIAGHHNSSIGNFSNESSTQYSALLNPTAASPQIGPSTR